ncbi:MAG TPA: helix-turn-helix domain-containing protein [Candidatus Thermoplasmatota archaeon]|nr:helix-turn-helix domain-containing protein [Candidatus Thermoplasmatota archaeon]
MSGESPSAGELVERLASIGVEEREAKLFVHLCLRGPTRASDAAAATKLKRTETYRALESLMRRGFVTAHLTRPVVYEAVAPDAVFGELLAGHEQRRAEIESLRERVSAAVATAREAQEPSGARWGYKIVQGRRAILGAVEGVVRNARSSESMVSTTFGPGMVSPQNKAYQTMLKRASEGLPMRILLRDLPGLDRALAPLTAHRHVEVRYFHPHHAFRFLIVDDREVVYWLINDPAASIDAREDVAMWTNATDFVLAQKSLFESLWASARESIRVPAR